MMERGSDGYRLKICPDNKRDSATLMGLIKNTLNPGLRFTLTVGRVIWLFQSTDTSFLQ